MRYFELKNGDDSNFWNIEIEGNCVFKTYGKIGYNGRDVKDEYATEEFAKKDALKLIQKKLKEGYVELPAGDADHEKWYDEEAAAKAAKEALKQQKKKDKPAKSKEKREPIALEFMPSGLEIQHDTGNKATFGDLKIVGSYRCAGNDIAGYSEVNEGLQHFGRYLATVSESWFEVTDLFDLQKGTCCRVTPPDAERRVAAVLMDNNYLYAMAIKGFEAEFRNLVKYDIDTHEIVWSCGTSASVIKPRFAQDEENIYASDVKMLYITSKSLGTTTTKIEIGNKMDNRQRIQAITAPRFVHVHKTGGTNMVLCASLMNIVLVDPAKEASVWEIKSKQYGGKMLASYIHNDTLYVLGVDGKLFVINIPDGKIERELQIKHDHKLNRSAAFYMDQGELCTIFSDDKGGRTLLQINLTNYTCRADDYTAFLPSARYNTPYEVIRNGQIIAAADKLLVIVDKNSGKRISSLELSGGKLESISDFIVAGDYIYLAQTVEKGETREAIVYQIK